ncbi:MAG: hypothetical protein V9G12_01925 [Microthrixaceae bacterium]
MNASRYLVSQSTTPNANKSGPTGEREADGFGKLEERVGGTPLQRCGPVHEASASAVGSLVVLMSGAQAARQAARQREIIPGLTQQDAVHDVLDVVRCAFAENELVGAEAIVASGKVELPTGSAPPEIRSGVEAAEADRRSQPPEP